MEIDGKPAFALDERSVPGGGALRYTGGAEALVCDSNWKEVTRVPVAADAVQIGSGAQQITFGCRSQSGTSLKIELRMLGPATTFGGQTGKQGPGNSNSVNLLSIKLRAGVGFPC